MRRFFRLFLYPEIEKLEVEKNTDRVGLITSSFERYTVTVKTNVKIPAYHDEIG